MIEGHDVAAGGDDRLTPEPRTPVASSRLVVWIAAVVVFVISALQIDSLPVGVMRDDAMYVVLAKSLATGEGYRWINLPDAPLATHFPPGYPALLAAMWHLFPSFPANVLAFKLTNALFLAIVAFITAQFAISRLGLSRHAAAIVGIVATLSVPMLSLGIRVMSEPLFLVVVIPTLLLAERLADGERRWWVVVGVGALAGLATLVRSHGIALVAAVPVTLLFHRRVRDAALSLGSSLALLLPWQLFVAGHQHQVPEAMRGSYESYSDWLLGAMRSGGVSLIARTVARTSGEIGRVLAGLVTAGGGPAVRSVALIPVLAILAVGARAFGKRAQTTVVFVAFYTAIVLVWPFESTRFVWGVWPLVILLAVGGLRELVTWRPRAPFHRMSSRVPQVAAVALAVCYTGGVWQAARTRAWSTTAFTSADRIRKVVRWVTSRTPSNAILEVNYEPAVYLYTGRRSVPANTLSAEQFIAPRTTSDNARLISEIMRHYRVNTVVLSADWLVDAGRSLAAQQPPELIESEAFDGGVVFTPVHRP